MLSFAVDVTGLRQAIGREFLADQDMEGLLSELGTMAFSLESQHFEKLSDHGTGDDGSQWKPLAKSTEIAKSEKGGWRPPDRKKKDQRQSIFQVLKKTASGQYDDVNPPQSQIGVDTGLLRNAIVPGYTGGDRLFNVNARGRSVTIGFAREYAKYFDAVRPLFPEDIPEAWIQQLDQIVEEFSEDMLQRRLAG